ncbi:MAG TPA: MBL fold metallo-hydrolase [Bacteroides sp.]|nr:MBL fold metallo-hydrolase [Bacteroides sp.]
MKEEKDYKIRRISLGGVSAYLLFKPGRAVLVDCGRGGLMNRILEALQGAGLQPEMLELLILTHAHFDHAGTAARIKAATGCRIMVHRSEADRLRKGFTQLPGGTRWKARVLVGLARVFARRLGKYEGVEPDILADTSYDLKEEFGFPARVIHTPGHTPGSMVVLTEAGEMFSGDTFFGLEGKEYFPPFAEDLTALLESWKMIRSLPVKVIYPAHGNRFTAQQFHDALEPALKKYGRVAPMRQGSER